MEVRKYNTEEYRKQEEFPVLLFYNRIPMLRDEDGNIMIVDDWGVMYDHKDIRNVIVFDYYKEIFYEYEFNGDTVTVEIHEKDEEYYKNALLNKLLLNRFGW